MTYVLLVLVIGLLVAWYFIRLGSNKPETGTDRRISDTSGNNSAFHAVSIKFEANACNAARAMAGRRFLASAAPKIPLPECEIMDCKCRFVHHKDRRTGKDRRSPFTSGGIAAASGQYERERRQGDDRREDEDPEDLL